jgi:hypothetical protein
MELIGDAVPGLVKCVVEAVESRSTRQEGDAIRVKGHEALVRLRKLVDVLSRFVLEPTPDLELSSVLAREMVDAYGEFASAFQDLGFHLTMSDSLGVFLARKLDAVVLRVARFLDEQQAVTN